MSKYLVLWENPNGISATLVPKNLFREIDEAEDLEEARTLFHKFREGEYLEYKRNPEFMGKRQETEDWPFNGKHIEKVICL